MPLARFLLIATAVALLSGVGGFAVAASGGPPPGGIGVLAEAIWLHDTDAEDPPAAETKPKRPEKGADRMAVGTASSSRRAGGGGFGAATGVDGGSTVRVTFAYTEDRSDPRRPPRTSGPQSTPTPRPTRPPGPTPEPQPTNQPDPTPTPDQTTQPPPPDPDPDPDPEPPPPPPPPPPDPDPEPPPPDPDPEPSP